MDGTFRHYPSAEEILESRDREVKEINVPEWGGWICFMPPTVEEVLRYRQATVGTANQTDETLALVGRAAVRVKPGSEPLEVLGRLFTDEQITGLRAKSAGVFLRVMREYTSVMKMDEGAVDAAKKASEEGSVS